jgi:hypothetical protein
MGKHNVYTLGTQGVDLTKSYIHADDGTFRQAQNAVPDMRGEFGGVAKRDGLTAINGTTAGGSVKGVVFAALPGDNQATFIFDADLAYSTDAFANTVVSELTTEAVDEAIRDDWYHDIMPGGGSPVEFAWTPLKSAVWKNRLFYASEPVLGPTGEAVPIRVLEADLSRKLFTRMPINPDVGALPKGITNMIVDGDYLYVSVWDAGTDSSDVKGSVYRIKADTGEMTKLGATFPTGYIPWCLTFYQGRLWAGTYSDDVSFSGRVYWIRPGVDSAWTLDHTTTAGKGEIMSLCPFEGKLYAATRGSNTNAALVKVRDLDGSWATSQTGVATTADQLYTSLAVFSGKLYAAYYNHNSGVSGRALIERYDGSSWSSVFDTNTSGTVASYSLVAAGPNLWALGVFRPGGLTRPMNVSTDGTTWANRSANNPSQSGPFFGTLRL